MDSIGDDALIHEFSQRWRASDPRLFYAPGRINLIGEHTDYNEGFVLPFALDRGTTVAAAARPDRLSQVYSLNLAESGAFDLDDPVKSNSHDWLNYVEGMAQSLGDCGVTLKGADLLIQSDVPLGAGLSSSAALEVAAGLAMCGVSDQSIAPLNAVKAAHRTETHYVGTQSGIMDPYVAMFAKQDCCLLIDCRTLVSKSIPWLPGDLAIVICNTGVKHALSTSQYNVRR